jgi:hypothetical protein
MKKLFVFFLLSFFVKGKGQQDSLNGELAKSSRYFSFVYENDLFSHTDRYYSQGVVIEFVLPFLRKSPLAKPLVKLNKNSQNYYGLRFEQDCFTPISIRFDTLNRLERPYSGTFAVGHYLISIDSEREQRLLTQLDIGLIGPWAKCEETQKGIHKALGNIQPLGWENQLSNDLLLNYKLEFEKALLTSKYAGLMALAESRMGTIYDDIGTGLHLRIGKMNSYFKNLGITKNSTVNKFQWYFNARAKAKFVCYNGTLQGGLFSESVHEIAAKDVTRVIFFSYMGIVLSYKRLSLEYAHTYITKEFKTGVDHGWGRCNITVCF